ncbi:MAG: hypothetical protein ACI8R8_003212 [Paraglaciecola sp.]
MAFTVIKSMHPVIPTITAEFVLDARDFSLSYGDQFTGEDCIVGINQQFTRTRHRTKATTIVVTLVFNGKRGLPGDVSQAILRN